MRMKMLILSVCIALCSYLQVKAANEIIDTIPENIQAIDPDIFLDKIHIQKPVPRRSVKLQPELHRAIHSYVPGIVPEIVQTYEIPAYIEPVKVDSMLLVSNPFFVDLILYPIKGALLPRVPKFNFGQMYFGTKAFCMDSIYIFEQKPQTAEEIIGNLRAQTRKRITREAIYLYAAHIENLPDPESMHNKVLMGAPLGQLQLPGTAPATFDVIGTPKINLNKFTGNPWNKQAIAMAQFTQNYISPNWYQGGNSSLNVLGRVFVEADYDNHGRLQWENSAEWRLGLNSVAGDTLRVLNTNDDVLRVNSKFGYKAGGNFYYSTSFDFSTPFFNTYQAVNSPTLKATFLTPVRTNLNIGMDMKYKKLLSVMVSPLSYKYIYIYQTDATVINPNLFGIEKGKNHLGELGSQLKAQLNWKATRDVQVDSKLSFYTNYTKVEIDWEIISNFTVNRFLSTRIALNPRYDNTVILAQGQKARIQLKELLSFGLSYKFWE